MEARPPRPIPTRSKPRARDCLALVNERGLELFTTGETPWCHIATWSSAPRRLELLSCCQRHSFRVVTTEDAGHRECRKRVVFREAEEKHELMGRLKRKHRSRAWVVPRESNVTPGRLRPTRRAYIATITASATARHLNRQGRARRGRSWRARGRRSPRGSRHRRSRTSPMGHCIKQVTWWTQSSEGRPSNSDAILGW